MNVNATQPVINYEDIGSIDIVIEIPVFIWGRISRARARGEEAVSGPLMVTFDAHPGEEYEVVLKEFQTTANPETQTYSVRLSMAQPEDFTVFPGMTAKVHSEFADATTDGYSLPVQALFGGNDGTKYVWVVGDDMTVKEVKVVTGEMSGDEMSITGGLKGGEKVVIAGVNTLQTGTEVSILGEKANKE